MFKDFSKFKFTVIDVETSNVPEMYINKNGITLNQVVINMLDNPEYVKPLIDMENKAFAIQVTKDKTSPCIKIGHTSKPKHTGYNSTCTSVRNVIRRLMADKWKDNMRYRMTGVLFPEQKAIVFDLTSAKELPLMRQRHE